MLRARCPCALLARSIRYEISAYGTARTFAGQLGHYDAVELLQETLEEESAANLQLTVLSEEEILLTAVELEKSVSERFRLSAWDLP